MGFDLPRSELRPVMILLLAGLALTGCQENKKAPVQGTAGGEVLPGSASDAMLPIDAVRSQPPLAPKAEPSGAKAGKADAPDKPKSESSQAAPQPEAPAAEAPAPAPAANE